MFTSNNVSEQLIRVQDKLGCMYAKCILSLIFSKDFQKLIPIQFFFLLIKTELNLRKSKSLKHKW